MRHEDDGQELSPAAGAGLLALRTVLGLLMAGHGLQKLFGVFGGYGPEGTGQYFESIGFPSGQAFAWIAGLTEFGAGIMLTVGFLTPLAVAGMVGICLNIAVAAHGSKGLWNADGGYEFPLLIGVTAAAIAITGPGKYSVDAVIPSFGRLLKPAVGYGAVGAGLLVGAATLLSRS